MYITSLSFRVICELCRLVKGSEQVTEKASGFPSFIDSYRCSNVSNAWMAWAPMQQTQRVQTQIKYKPNRVKIIINKYTRCNLQKQNRQNVSFEKSLDL